MRTLSNNNPLDDSACWPCCNFHAGLRGWADRKTVHEIVFPSALYIVSRGLTKQKGPGYNLPEFRPGYTLAAIKKGRLTLRYKPVGADTAAEKVCNLAQFTA